MISLFLVAQLFAQESNSRFLQAQKARLDAEIQQQLAIENSWIRYRGWERDAARVLRADKEKTRAMIEELEAHSLAKPIRCLSDIKAAAGLSADATDRLQSANQVYSKSGYFDTCGSDCLSRSATPGLRDQMRLAQQNTIDPEALREREASRPTETPKPLTPADLAKLAAFGVREARPSAGCRDLSGRFSTPKLQPPRTAKCAGYAVASDMEEVLNRRHVFGGRKKVSPEYAYVALAQGRRPTSSFCDLLGTYLDPLQGVASVAGALKGSAPICSSHASAPTAKPPRQYAIESVANAQFSPLDPPSPALLRALIDSGVAPMVTIASEARTEREDWLFPRRGGSYKHVLNLVGYCHGPDPDCLVDQEYFIVRDSLGAKAIHYRVPAKRFADMIEAIDKITGVREDAAN